MAQAPPSKVEIKVATAKNKGTIEGPILLDFSYDGVMSILRIVALAIVQGLAELLPISSSAHVIVAEKLMGLDPSSPQMTLLLVMLHTGTMFAVIAYFWKQWKKTYFSSSDAFKRFAIRVIWATLLTGIIGVVIKSGIEKTMFKGAPKAEIEDLFGRLDRRDPGTVPSVPRVLAVGRYDLDRDAGGREQGAGGAVQLCAGRGADPACGGAGGLAAAEGFARGYCGWDADRSAWQCGDQSARCGVCVLRGASGAEVVEQLAGRGALVSVRDLLPGCGLCCVWVTSRGVLEEEEHGPRISR